MGEPDQDCAPLGAHRLQARSQERTLQPNHRDRLLGVFRRGRRAGNLERMDTRSLAHQNGSHHVRDVAFAEDASRIRKNPDIAARLRSFAYNIIRATGGDNVRNTRWRAALDLAVILKMPGISQN